MLAGTAGSALGLLRRHRNALSRRDLQEALPTLRLFPATHTDLEEGRHAGTVTSPADGRGRPHGPEMGER